MENKAQPIAKMATLVTAVIIVSRLLGFARETLIANIFGVGLMTDIYIIATRIVVTAGLVVSVYMAKTFVPSYIHYREMHGDKKALHIANNALGVALIINTCLMLILMFMSPLILATMGLDEQHADLARVPVMIMLFKLPLLTFVEFFTAYLTARKSFVGANFIGIPLSIVFMAVCFIIGAQGGATGLSIASVASIMAQLIVIFIWVSRTEYQFNFSAHFNLPEMRRDMQIFAPALLSSVLLNINVWVDTTIAVRLGEGSVTAIGFADRLLGLMGGLVIVPLSGMAYSYMSGYAAKNAINKMLQILWQSSRVMLFLILPMVAISIIFSAEIVEIVFQRGRFTPEAGDLTSLAFMWYLPALPSFAIHTLVIRFYYGIHDTKTPLYCGIVAVSVGVLLSLGLSGYMGVGGLGLASSISTGLSTILLLILLRRKIGSLGFRKTAVDFIKMGFCIIPCLLTAFAIQHLLSDAHVILRFAGGAVAGGIAYLLMAALLREMVMVDAIRVTRGYLRI